MFPSRFCRFHTFFSFPQLVNNIFISHFLNRILRKFCQKQHVAQFIYLPIRTNWHPIQLMRRQWTFIKCMIFRKLVRIHSKWKCIRILTSHIRNISVGFFKQKFTTFFRYFTRFHIKNIRHFYVSALVIYIHQIQQPHNFLITIEHWRSG